MTEFTKIQITVRATDNDDGFRDIQRMMFVRDMRNMRRELETERRRRQLARRNQERERVIRKWKFRAFLVAVILVQIGMIAGALWRR